MPRHMCGSFMFVPSKLKVDEMAALVEVQKEARDRESRTLGGYKKLPFYDFPP